MAEIPAPRGERWMPLPRSGETMAEYAARVPEFRERTRDELAAAVSRWRRLADPVRWAALRDRSVDPLPPALRLHESAEKYEQRVQLWWRARYGWPSEDER
jgi:hypothetical protein